MGDFFFPFFFNPHFLIFFDGEHTNIFYFCNFKNLKCLHFIPQTETTNHCAPCTAQPEGKFLSTTLPEASESKQMRKRVKLRTWAATDIASVTACGRGPGNHMLDKHEDSAGLGRLAKAEAERPRTPGSSRRGGGQIEAQPSTWHKVSIQQTIPK